MDTERKNELSVEDELYRVGLILLPFGVMGAYVLTRFLVPHLPASAECLFWKFWGVYCPGCGGTRAVIALMQGKFLLSAWYHPLVMYVVVMYGCFMLSHTFEKLHFPLIKGMRFRVGIMYGALVVLALNFVLKNVLKFCFGVVML
jgi:fatty acid desaturase